MKTARFTFALLAILAAEGVAARPDPATFLDRATRAIDTQDFETIEGLRDEVRPANLPAIVKKWNANLPWAKKDAFIALLMDQMDPIVQPMMKDALNSPTPESRAYALCILKGDFKLLPKWLDKTGFLIPAKVDQAVLEYKKQQNKK